MINLFLISFKDVYPIIIVFICTIGFLALFILLINLTNKYVTKKKESNNLPKNELNRETKIYQLLYEKGGEDGLNKDTIIEELDYKTNEEVINIDLENMINKNIIEMKNNKYKIKNGN